MKAPILYFKSLIFLLFLSASLNAQVNGPVCFTYTNSPATFSTGLGSSLVNGVYASGSTVYAATQNGLSISTDAGATFLNKTTTNGLGANFIYGVSVSGNTVYAATPNGLSISTDGGTTFTNKTTANGLADNAVRGVYSAGNTVYVATQNGLSISTDGGATFTNKTTSNGLGSNMVVGVSASGSTVCAATPNGLSISTDGGNTFTNRSTSSLGTNSVRAVYVSGSTIYAATDGAGLSISTDGGATFTNKTTSNGLGSNSLRGVYASGSTVYVSSLGGLSISTDGGGTFTNKTTTNGLGDNVVFGAFTSGSTLYAATNGGLSTSIDGGTTFTNKTSTIPSGNGLGNNSVKGVYVSGSTVYAATAGGLSISVDGGANFTNKTTANGLGNNTIRGVFVVGSTVYAATSGGLSISTDGGTTFTNRTTTNGLGNNNVYGVYASGSTVYTATSAGLSISSDGGSTFTNKTTANGLGSNIVNGVYASGSTVYAATNNGLSISTDGGATFTNRTTANGLGYTLVYGVYASGSKVYAATYSGLSISTDGGDTFTNKAPWDGLGAWGILGVYTSGSTVYAATGNGISISTNGGTTFTNKTTTNGLGSNTVNGVYASGSTVYAATEGGLSFCSDPCAPTSSTVSSCDSYTWSLNGQTYTQSGTYTNVNGCVTNILNLTITPSNSISSTAEQCGSYTWALNGQTYTQSGTYTAVTGCTTNYLTLTINPSNFLVDFSPLSFPPNCFTKGGAALSNNRADTVANYTFNTSTVPSNMLLSGNASITSGVLRLTPNSGNQNGGAQISGAGNSVDSLSVRFRLITPQSTNAADGISYNFCDDGRGNAGGHNGTGTKLTISFDSYSNSTGNTPGIYLMYNPSLNPANNASNVLAYSNNVSWRGSSGTSVRISVSSTGLLNLSLNGTAIFTNIQLPAGYTTADKSGWAHFFNASTGASTSEHSVDSLNIITWGAASGTKRLVTLASNDFTSTTLPSNMSIAGSATITSGYLRLTPNQTSQAGGLRIDSAGTDVDELSVQFKLFVLQNGADGLSYSFCDDGSVSSTTISPQNGTGSKLAISFDSWANTNNPAGIYLMYAPSSNPTTGGSNVLAYSSDVSWRNNASGKVVKITVSRNGSLNLTLDGTPIFTNVMLPPAYISADKSGWAHYIRAATGGSSQEHRIDDLVIRTSESTTFSELLRRETVNAYSASGDGSACWDFYNIASGEELSLVSYLFNPLAVPHYLRFDLSGAPNTGGEVDTIFVEHSSNGGSSWTSVAILDNAPTTGEFDQGAASASAFTPTSTQWDSLSYTIPAGANKIRFRGVSDNGNRVYLDNLSLRPSCVAPTLSATTTAPSCQGLSDGAINLTTAGGYPTPFTFQWNNGASTEDLSNLSAGTYTVTVTIGACSATASYTVNAGQAPGSNTTTASGCDSYTWSMNGQTYTQSGSYTSANGCATETLILTITSSSSNTTTASSCGSYTWSVNGQTYTQSGSYTSTSGCASEILALTIIPASSNTTTTSTCDSYFWRVTGQTYTQSGSYTSVSGCSSEILALTIIPSSSNTTTASACDSYTWSVTGQTYTQSGSYTNASGCTTEILSLTIAPSSNNTTTASACGSYSWSVNGQTYTQSGSYTSVSGCSSKILSLTIIPSSSNTTTASACDSYTWSVTGQTYTQSGSYSSVSGCAYEILTLTITPGSTYYEDADGDGYGNAASYQSTCAQPTGYVTNLSDCNDADGSINPGVPFDGCNGVDNDCDGAVDDNVSYSLYYPDVDGDGYGAISSVYLCTPPSGYVSVTGDCDDSNSNVNPAASEICNSIDDNCNGTTDEGLTGQTTTASACDSYTWSVDGNTYTQSGSYSSGGVSGCATEVLNLNIIPSTSNTTAETATTSYTWSVDGQTYTQSGSYTSVSGCATEILNLTINTSCTPTPQPSIACYEIATWNTTTCQWDIAGTQPAQPSTACYETASFNTTTCQWDVTGTQPTQPSIACYETATFNGTTCQWDVTGTQPSQPTIACYESASFNTTTCSWDVTGTQPTQPGIACYETATFNGTTCQWDVTGNQPAQPTIACYESASFNTTTCLWDVTGTQPAPIVSTESVCDTYTWAQNGQTYTASGTYSSSVNCQDYVLNLTISANASYYADSDGDGYGSNTVSSSNCTGVAPAGYISTSGDCNDNNASVKPGATEHCNSIDDDCDGLVDDNPLPVVTGSISGTSLSCRARVDGTATFTLNGATPGASSVWSVPSGFNITSGQGTPTINVSFTASAIDPGISGPLCMNITDACGSSASVCANIDYQITAPVTPPSISGPSKPCPGDVATYAIASVARATAYTWSFPQGVTLISGQGSNIVQVSIGAGFTGGNIGVMASNTCGNSPIRTRNILNAGGPPTPSAISGLKFGLCNSTSVVYTANPVTGATSYLWTVSGGGVIVSGQGTGSITVDYPSFTAGNITVQAANSCGASQLRTLYVTGAPGKPEAITGAAPVCRNATEAYSIPTVNGTGANGYNWTVTSAGTITSGQGTKNISVLWHTLASSQALQVNATNACGTGPNTSRGNITVNACSREDLSAAGMEMKVYPNPAQDRTHVVFNANSEDTYRLNLTDMSGRTILSETGTTATGRNEFDVYFGDAQAGVYFIEIRTGESYARMRIVIAN